MPTSLSSRRATSIHSTGSRVARRNSPSTGQIHHTIAGISYPQTKTYQQVIEHMEGAVAAILAYPIPPPELELLICQGLWRYAYEDIGHDEYLIWHDWPIIAAAVWEKWREFVWAQSPEVLGHGIPLVGSAQVAVDDCEGAATHRVAWARARGERAWVVCQEFRDVWTKEVTGWHALCALEIENGRRHVASIPWPDNVYVLPYPYEMVARPGYHIEICDLAWMGGMPRKREGRFAIHNLRRA